MPWYATHVGGHPNHADAGSDAAVVFERLGYVEVDAPEPVEPVLVATSAPDRDEQRGHGGPVGDDETFGS